MSDGVGEGVLARSGKSRASLKVPPRRDTTVRLVAYVLGPARVASGAAFEGASPFPGCELEVGGD